MNLRIVADVQTKPKKIADHSIVGWGYTYFVRHRDAIKIGFSGAPKERIKAIQISFPDPLEVLAIVPYTIIDEPTAHQRFVHLRMSGEWFKAAPDLLEFIEQIKIEAAKAPKGQYPTMKATALADEIDRCCRHLARLRRTQPPEMRVLVNRLIEHLKDLPRNPDAMRPLIRRTIELIEPPTPAP